MSSKAMGLLLTDIDGTLPSASEADPMFRMARDMGVRIAVVTARTLEDALPIMRRYGIAEQILAVEMGAQILSGYEPIYSAEPPQHMPVTAACAAAIAGACRLDDWNGSRRFTQCVIMPGEANACGTVVDSLLPMGYTVTSSGVTALVHPTNVNKGMCAAWLLDYFNHPPAIALGDSAADVPMVKVVGGHSRILRNPKQWKTAVLNWLISLGN